MRHLKKLLILLVLTTYNLQLTTLSVSALTLPTSAPLQSPLCTTTPDNKPGISTALGCIPYANDSVGTNAAKITIEILLSWLTGLSGLAGFLALVYAAFLIVTSAGDIKKVQAGKELAGAAIGAIVFVTLSVVILNFIGLNVLGLGSFNSGFNV